MADSAAKPVTVPSTPKPTGVDLADDSIEDKPFLINVFADRSLAGNGNTRTLDFQARDLGLDIDLLLMFEPPEKAGKLYVDIFPICWKVISIASSGIAGGSVVYTAKTGLFVPQVDSGNVVAASNAQPCATGQKCTLKTNAKGNDYLTAAVDGTPGFIKCLNATGTPGDVGFGFFNKSGTKVEPALIWNNIANQSTLSVQLTPKLKIYAVSDYKESEIIRGDIESPCLWEKNLISLKPSTEWNVSVDAGTGEIVIKEA